MEETPKPNFKEIKEKSSYIFKNTFFQILALIGIVIIALLFYSGVIYFGFGVNNLLGVNSQITANSIKEAPAQQYAAKDEYEQDIINTVKQTSPSVVSIIISKNLPVYQQQFISPFGDVPGLNVQIPQYVQNGTQQQEVGAGSGFIISSDGLVLTNKHVVSDQQADYTVLTNDGKKYTAKVLALDPVQDLALVKIQSSDTFPAITLGDSSGIQIGQGAIAIGNALGEFRNTVSVGVISGLGRTISASGGQGDSSETLEDVIQTDAAINLGNSGGPLLNLNGEVIGINTATAEGAQAIGFAIPINIAKRDIDQVTKSNKITYPFLGVRYVLVDDTVKQQYKLSVDYGAYIMPSTDGQPSITAGSAAEKAGLKEKDIILELNGEKITQDNSMSKLIQKYNPGDKVTLKVLRDGKEMDVQVTLGERS